MAGQTPSTSSKKYLTEPEAHQLKQRILRPVLLATDESSKVQAYERLVILATTTPLTRQSFAAREVIDELNQTEIQELWLKRLSKNTQEAKMKLDTAYERYRAKADEQERKSPCVIKPQKRLEPLPLTPSQAQQVLVPSLLKPSNTTWLQDFCASAWFWIVMRLTHWRRFV